MQKMINEETEASVCGRLAEGRPRDAVTLICDWWNTHHRVGMAASHFGIFVKKKNGKTCKSLIPDDPDERTVDEVETLASVYRLGSAYIEFRFDQVEDDVRYTFNMDGEAIECAIAPLETFLSWNAKALTAWWTLVAGRRTDFSVRRENTKGAGLLQ